jgi:FkbM family methyltransferase
LGGTRIWIRPGTTDLNVFKETFLAGYHLPPPELGADVRLIWDLGSHIGTTMVHLCHLFPHARVIGVELEPDNVRLCRLNVAPWQDRCEVIEAAVWARGGEVEYAGEGWASTIRPGGGKIARALMLNSLLGSGESVDFVKMDIEGAEKEVLRVNTDWASRVRAIKVEIHGEYSVADCFRDLERLGFDTLADPKHWACAVGLKGGRL